MSAARSLRTARAVASSIPAVFPGSNSCLIGGPRRQIACIRMNTRRKHWSIKNPLNTNHLKKSFPMLKRPFSSPAHCGVDISKKTFNWHCQGVDGELANDSQGFAQLLQQLKGIKSCKIKDLHVVLESTGGYESPLAPLPARQGHRPDHRQLGRARAPLPNRGAWPKPTALTPAPSPFTPAASPPGSRCPPRRPPRKKTACWAPCATPAARWSRSAP